jgi:hypothetical protein
MSGTETGCPTQGDAAAMKDDALIARAARRADLAGTALAGAAADLGNAHSRDGNALTGLAEVIWDEAGRVSRLVEDIESHRPIRAEEPAIAASRGRRQG